MKLNYRSIVLGVAAVVMLSSCKKWLDVTASNQIAADDQFAEAAGYKDALMGAYITMTTPAAYGRDMTWNLVDLLSQQYNTLTSLAPYSEVQKYNYLSTRSVGYIDSMWYAQYNTIANINIELANIDKNKSLLNNIDYSVIKGELLGLRAFLHFDLMRLYGHGNYANRPELASKKTIPYVKIYGKNPTPQLSYPETFALMEADISESLELLKQDIIFPDASRPANYYMEVNRDGFLNKRELRMNYYAVKALQARVFLWEGSADKKIQAAQAAEVVISQSPAKLITNSGVGVNKLFPSEQLFGLNITAFANLVNPFLLAQLTTDYNALYMTSAAANTLFETSNSNIGLVDIRYTTLLSEPTAGRKVSTKLTQTTTDPYRNIMPLIKLPEMYYIAAEAYITTNLPKAIEYLNKVRSSRGIIQPIESNATAETVKAELTKEYRKEFVSEGQLFFYFKRTGATTIPGLAVTTIVNDNIYVLPYPQSEIEFGGRLQ